MSKVNDNCHQLPITSSVHNGVYFYQVTSISDQYSFRDFVRADTQAPSKTIPACSIDGAHVTTTYTTTTTTTTATTTVTIKLCPRGAHACARLLFC